MAEWNLQIGTLTALLQAILSSQQRFSHTVIVPKCKTRLIRGIETVHKVSSMGTFLVSESGLLPSLSGCIALRPVSEHFSRKDSLVPQFRKDVYPAGPTVHRANDHKIPTSASQIRLALAVLVAELLS